MTYEVVVVGGGVVGAATLYHLALAGCSGAVLLERETIGSGSTSKAAGGFRAQFSDELNIRIALRSIDRLARFGDEPGFDIDFKQWGYLFLVSQDDEDTFRSSVDLQRDLGVPTEWLTPDEAAEMVPGLDVTGITAATFGPLDGYATPEAVAQGYAVAARRLGATVRQGVEVVRISSDRGRVTGVELRDGSSVSADTVICCTGVWAPDLVTPLGLDLPVRPERRDVFFTGTDPLVHRLPLTIDFATGFYFHREGTGLLLGGREHSLEDLAPHAMARLPMLEDLEVRHGWWGWYAMSPDHNAIVGRADEPDGLLYATGFSGHGFQQGPVVGEYLAALALDQPPPLDLAALSADRFAAGDLRPEKNVV